VGSVCPDEAARAAAPPRPALGARVRAVAWRRWALIVGLTVPVTVGLGAVSVPSPALFAGLLVGTVLALLGRAPRAVPQPATTGAQAVIGVVIGLIAQSDTLAAVARDWLPVLGIGLATLLASMGAGLLLGVQRGVSPLTGMLALTAGGASGLVAISRELGGDERVVAVVQYLRVGLVTATMPVVAALAFGARHGAPGGDTAASAPWYVGLGVLAFCCAVGVPLGVLTRVPAGALLGPMVVALVLALTGWSFGSTPPSLVVDVAYAVIGWQAGVRFTRESLRTVARVLPLAIGLIVVIIGACAALGVVLAHLTGSTLLEGYLATTPGGIYAVLATAISAGTNVTFVVAMQVLRVVLMLLIAPFLARLAGRRWGTTGRD